MEEQYQKTLDFLYAQLPMFQRTGAIQYKIDLQKTIDVCQWLNNPQDKLLCIHIAGTNGKGSVSHFITSVLQSAGLRVGLYTSPHYKDFRERIKINGEYIDQQYVIDFVERTKPMIEALHPSFFELTSAMALEYFVAQRVDVAVIETGLGGRLDSTNVIHPMLSIITNISFDHQDFLGDTLSEIASEKAGIIKQNTPIVVGEYQDTVIEVFRKKAEEMCAPLTIAEKVYKAYTIYSFENHTHFDISKNGFMIYKNLSVNVLGYYQNKNICTALQSIDVLNSIKKLPEITEEHIRQGLRDLVVQTRFQGRWQVLSKSPLTVADSAHNEAGIQFLVTQLARQRYENLHIIFGTVKDKDPAKVLSQLPDRATYYFAKAAIPRGLNSEELRLKAAEYGLKGGAYSSVEEAYLAAQKAATANDLILITGSIFVVAEVL